MLRSGSAPIRGWKTPMSNHGCQLAQGCQGTGIMAKYKYSGHGLQLQLLKQTNLTEEYGGFHFCYKNTGRLLFNEFVSSERLQMV